MAVSPVSRAVRMSRRASSLRVQDLFSRCWRSQGPRPGWWSCGASGVVAVAGDVADETEAGEFAAGAAGGGRGDAEFGGDLVLGRELAAGGGGVGGFDELVGSPDPGAGVGRSSTDGHHVTLAQTVRPPVPVVSVP